MSEGIQLLQALRDRRLSPHIASARPAWLITQDGRRILWANDAGAAIFGHGTMAAATGAPLDVADPHRMATVQLAARLPANGDARLERLRAFGAGLGRLQTCVCARLELDGHEPGVLVASTEPFARGGSYPDRLRAAIAESDASLGIFDLTGRLQMATPTLRGVIGDAATLTALGLDRGPDPDAANLAEPIPMADHWLELVPIGTGGERALVLIATPIASTHAADQSSEEAPAPPQQATSLHDAASPAMHDPAILTNTTVEATSSGGSDRDPAGTDATPSPDGASPRDDKDSKPAPEHDDARPPHNVVPFRGTAESRIPTLSVGEAHAFNELARQIAERLSASGISIAGSGTRDFERSEDGAADADESRRSRATFPAMGPESEGGRPPFVQQTIERSVLDRIPVGVLIYRLDRLLYANHAFFEHTGYHSLAALEDAGGLGAFLVEPVLPDGQRPQDDGTPLLVTIPHNQCEPFDARLFALPPARGPLESHQVLALVLAAPSPRVVDVPRRTEPLPAEPPPSLDRAAVSDARAADIDAMEREIATLRQQLARAGDERSSLLAKISHDIRTPMTAIAGFAEIMIEGRFGALANPRYAEYLKDMRACSERVIALIDDLNDLARAQAGKLELDFSNVTINPLVEDCVAALQPRANRARIIIRTALAQNLPPVTADLRTLRQIAINLIANAIQLAQTGGQVIVSTAMNDAHEVTLSVRDTGPGMSEKDISATLEPFRIMADDNAPSLGAAALALTKALTDANHARFSIRNTHPVGTLIEVAFAHRLAGHASEKSLAR